MVRRANYTTLLLFLIVIILLFGVGIALYYVLDLDWVSKYYVQIYNEANSNQEEQIKVEVKKEIKYDESRRTYNLELITDELKIIVYKDGTVGVSMLENEKYAQINGYTELVNIEIKLTLTNIIRAYNVKVADENTSNDYIVLLDSDGNLYKLVESTLIENGQYTFVKIEGLAKIIDVRQITNDGLVENTEGINAIAIDEESNELLLTDYLLKD